MASEQAQAESEQAHAELGPRGRLSLTFCISLAFGMMTGAAVKICSQRET
jgi:hypothetical protein